MDLSEISAHLSTIHLSIPRFTSHWKFYERDRSSEKAAALQVSGIIFCSVLK